MLPKRFYQGFLAKQITLKERIKKRLKKKEKGLLGQAGQKDGEGWGIRERGGGSERAWDG